MENKPSEPQVKESKINTQVLIAIIGAVTTIATTIITVSLNKEKTPEPTPTPMVIVVTNTPAPIPATETTIPPTFTEVPPTATFTVTPEPPTPTETAIPTGVYQASLSFEKDGPAQTQFKPNTPIWVMADINDPTQKRGLTLQWVAVQVVDMNPNVKLTSAIRTAKGDHFAEQFNPVLKLPGKYQLDIYLNGNTLTPSISVPFEIVP